jgi:hypothetical protein
VIPGSLGAIPYYLPNTIIPYNVGMNQDEKREYNRLYGIANRERIKAKREARRAGLGDNVRRCSIPGCDGIYDTHGLCARHYMAWKRNGDPTEVRQIQHHGKTIAERLALYTRRMRGCWEWTGARSAKGYGVTRVNGLDRSRLAHRVAWELEHGPIPAGLYVLHRCDNPGCLRVAHLFLGTKAENNADMRAKKRHHTKLTEANVRAIRRSSARRIDLAEKYGVSGTLISAIRERRAWKHIK